MDKVKKHTGPSAKIKCEICGKVVSARGMLGHVRWTHGPESVQVKRRWSGKKMETQKTTSTETQKLFDLVDELRQVRKKIKEAEESDTSWFFTPEDVQVEIDALKKKKNEIAEKIKELQGLEQKEEED
jgi:uncharacterized coiled-coil DUF342 family protein